MHACMRLRSSGVFSCAVKNAGNIYSTWSSDSSIIISFLTVLHVLLGLCMCRYEYAKHACAAFSCHLGAKLCTYESIYSTCAGNAKVLYVAKIYTVQVLDSIPGFICKFVANACQPRDIFNTCYQRREV